MDPDRTLFALVARRVPAIWDVVGPASLNPQPLPPIDVPRYVDPLNPQPLPPGPPPEVYGATVGLELVKLQWQADKLGLALPAVSTWADDPAPTPPRRPSLPPWLPQVGEPNEAWLEGYYLGLACALAVAPEPTGAHPSTGTTEARPGLTADLFERATTALGQLGAATSA